MFADRGHGQPLISTRNGGATAAEAACQSIRHVHSAMLVQTPSRQPQKALSKESKFCPANSNVAAKTTTSTLSSAGATHKKEMGMRG